MRNQRKRTKLTSKVLIAKFMLKTIDEIIPMEEWVRSLVPAKPCQSCSIHVKRCDTKLAMISYIVVGKVLCSLE